MYSSVYEKLIDLINWHQWFDVVCCG